MLCVTHSFLSSLMFFLVDCVQKRYKTRLITEISGILTKTPNLGIACLLMVVLYSGIPFSIKFSSEIYIFSGLFESSMITFMLLIYSANFIGLLGFSKVWFNCIFGLSMKNGKNPQLDLNLKDSLIIFICVFFSFYLNFFSNIFLI